MDYVFRHPVFTEAIEKYFDVEDTLTRKTVLAVNEVDQSQLLTSLTSKLYDNIIDKVDEIDFGEIPRTKGDITKLSNYEKLVDSVELLEQILINYKQKTETTTTIKNAIENIKLRKELFERAYKFNVEVPIIMYNTITLSIISAVSVMIASCIDFIKTPNSENFELSLDRTGLIKTKDNLLFTNLDKFNSSCRKQDFDKAMNHIMNTNIKNFTGAALGTVGAIATIGIILNIIPILRELIFFFYYSRTRISDYFDTQSDLLLMNAYNYEYNGANRSQEDKKDIVKTQTNIANMFKKISNAISINSKQGQVKAEKEISSTDYKFKTTDLMDSSPDSATSALF